MILTKGVVKTLGYFCSLLNPMLRAILSLREACHPRNIHCILTRALIVLAVLFTERTSERQEYSQRTQGFDSYLPRETSGPQEYSEGIQGLVTTGYLV